MHTKSIRLYLLIQIALAVVFPVSAAASLQHAVAQYAHVDRHAESAPQTLSTNPDQLAAYLTKPFNSPEEKARSIYTWIISNIRYDASGYMAKSYVSKSVDEILRTRNGVCDGFAKVFQALADRAGLEVISIEGRVKTVSNGDDWPENRGNHVWNAIRIQGEWKIIDSTWASGFVRTDGFKRQPNHFFFLVPPEALLTSHFDLKDTFGIQARHQLTLREFLQLEQSPPTILQLGFAGHTVLNELRNRNFQGLVSTYDHPFGTLKVNSAPAGKLLHKNEVLFDLESSQFSEITVFNNNHMHTVKPENGRFVFSYKARESGSVLVAGKKVSDATYTGVLGYEAR